MITEISIENFLSIKEKVTISLDSSASKKLPQNLINLSEKETLLKSAVIYGANASGKSNLIRALFFMWSMVKISHTFNIETKIPRTPFRLDPLFLEKPSKFEIVFIHESIKYKYGFSCDEDKVIEEYLFYWPKGREAQIFKRSNTKEFDFTSDKTQQELIKKQMTDNVLYLSRATQLGYEKTKKAYEFLVEYMVINYNPNWEEFTIRQIYENHELKNKIIEILQKADFGGIIDIEVIKNKRKESGFRFKLEKDTPTVEPLKAEDREFYDIRFKHKTKEGDFVNFMWAEESHGTQKTLAVLGPIFDILKSGKVAFIDEFEINLHPSITRFLVKLFHSKHNKKNAQLIFTTHDTTLLRDNDLFRRDQIYICSKEPNKGTTVDSFLDYDLRESTDFERAYLTGRVGGIPYIDETILD